MASPTMSAPTVQWMWGDASIVGRGVARWNPLRWSGRISFDEAILDLQQLPLQHRTRPVAIKVQETDLVTTDTKVLLSQHLSNVDDAISRLRELSADPANLHVGAPCADAATSSNNLSRSSDAGASGSTAGELGDAVAEAEQVSAEEAAPAEPTAERQRTTGSQSSERQNLAGAERQRTTGSQSSERQNLAGMLEKQSRWRKEWAFRFFVIRHDRIDYYLTPPTLMEDEVPRGSIPLGHAVAAKDEYSERSFCMSIASELLCCKTFAEQQRWLETINAANSAFQRSRGPPDKQILTASLMAANLLLIPPGLSEELVPMQWHKQSSVSVAGSQSSATLLFVDGGSSRNGGASGLPAGATQAICRLPLFDWAAGTLSNAPVQLLGDTSQESSRDLNLCVKIHSNELEEADERSSYMSWVISISVLAVASLLSSSTWLASLAFIVAYALLFHEARRAPPPPPRRLIKFSAEKVESGTPATLGPLLTTPGWVGQWRLDKSCSEPYAPILEDLGVNFLLRKAADAANSVMTITTTATHLSVVLKIWVTVEDCIPLDGSSATKAVPPGSSKMRGECRVKIAKATATELEMYTEFPDGNGALRDYLTMNEDGNSFTRIVVRGPLKVTRVFRRVTG